MLEKNRVSPVSMLLSTSQAQSRNNKVPHAIYKSIGLFFFVVRRAAINKLQGSGLENEGKKLVNRIAFFVNPSFLFSFPSWVVSLIDEFHLGHYTATHLMATNGCGRTLVLS